MSRKWYKTLCECGNCKSQRAERFKFAMDANTAELVCKNCGCKGRMSVVGPAPKQEKKIKVETEDDDKVT